MTHLKDMDSVLFGLTRDEFKNLAFIYAKKNNLNYLENWDKTPEATSLERAKGFNRRISRTTNKPPKVLSAKGKKQVGIIASAERDQLTTVIGCCNSAGSFLPPFLIFASAVAIYAIHGFEKPGIWSVNKYAFGDGDYEPAAVIAGTSIDSPAEIISSPNEEATPSELQTFVAPIVVSLKTPEKIHSNGGRTPESEPGCSKVFSTFEPDTVTNVQKSNTMLPETEVNIQRYTSRDNPLDQKPG
ncbi:hypothetical protein PV327_004157 [Microctonus hyperodae]|uniref:Uncharacterized protein n=1 Tax=Microctonus hyperodae TaxID=165561 RepID=A0AA39FBU9_MICHY|nr:hypothetical protein PV327_004157 [Microctonus hyperodae]